MLAPQDFVIAFAAGAVSFASPCMLPLVPGFVAWSASGTPAVESGPDAEAQPGDGPPSPVVLAVLFVAGFTAIFVALGVASGVVGSTLAVATRPIQIAGGLLVAAMGLFMLADRWLPARVQQRVGARERRFAPTPLGAVGFGAVFGAAWSPCIGPTLGAILTLAASTGGALSGGVLLVAFAAGLGVPFIALASGIGGAARVLPVLRRHTGRIRLASGAVLMVFGLLLASGVIGRLSSSLSAIPGLEI
ncbi:MAG: sulfite exporter TauE/SafE family protein [Solirubrobacteraceae bacterium]|nr:sulfite exporter TauE/SafE family protein [Solirubrobacteraceae bacterium]